MQCIDKSTLIEHPLQLQWSTSFVQRCLTCVLPHTYTCIIFVLYLQIQKTAWWWENQTQSECWITEKVLPRSNKATSHKVNYSICICVLLFSLTHSCVLYGPRKWEVCKLHELIIRNNKVTIFAYSYVALWSFIWICSEGAHL